MEERKIYGCMDGDSIRAIELTPQLQKLKNSKTGEVVTRIVSVIEQAAELPPEYKPVDDIDEGKQDASKEGYVIRIVPYDAGDRISFRYIEVPDLNKVRREIDELKNELAASDYKIIKCYEAFLIGSNTPYDISELHSQRQLARDKINELEEKYSQLCNETIKSI